MRLKVRVSNALYAKRHLYACYIPEYHDYVGDVVPNPPWVKEDSFCMSTGDVDYPVRIISRDSVVCGWLLEDRPIDQDTRVVYSNGRSYVVTRRGDRVTCNCTGYAFRKTCSHTAEFMAEAA